MHRYINLLLYDDSVDRIEMILRREYELKDEEEIKTIITYLSKKNDEYVIKSINFIKKINDKTKGKIANVSLINFIDNEFELYCNKYNVKEEEREILYKYVMKNSKIMNKIPSSGYSKYFGIKTGTINLLSDHNGSVNEKTNTKLLYEIANIHYNNILPIKNSLRKLDKSYSENFNNMNAKICQENSVLNKWLKKPGNCTFIHPLIFSLFFIPDKIINKYFLETTISSAMLSRMHKYIDNDILVINYGDEVINNQEFIKRLMYDKFNEKIKNTNSGQFEFTVDMYNRVNMQYALLKNVYILRSGMYIENVYGNTNEFESFINFLSNYHFPLCSSDEYSICCIYKLLNIFSLNSISTTCYDVIDQQITTMEIINLPIINYKISDIIQYTKSQRTLKNDPNFFFTITEDTLDEISDTFFEECNIVTKYKKTRKLLHDFMIIYINRRTLISSIEGVNEGLDGRTKLQYQFSYGSYRHVDGKNSYYYFNDEFIGVDITFNVNNKKMFLKSFITSSMQLIPSIHHNNIPVESSYVLEYEKERIKSIYCYNPSNVKIKGLKLWEDNNAPLLNDNAPHDITYPPIIKYSANSFREYMTNINNTYCNLMNEGSDGCDKFVDTLLNSLPMINYHDTMITDYIDVVKRYYVDGETDNLPSNELLNFYPTLLFKLMLGIIGENLTNPIVCNFSNINRFYTLAKKSCFDFKKIQCDIPLNCCDYFAYFDINIHGNQTVYYKESDLKVNIDFIYPKFNQPINSYHNRCMIDILFSDDTSVFRYHPVRISTINYIHNNHYIPKPKNSENQLPYQLIHKSFIPNLDFNHIYLNRLQTDESGFNYLHFNEEIKEDNQNKFLIKMSKHSAKVRAYLNDKMSCLPQKCKYILTDKDGCIENVLNMYATNKILTLMTLFENVVEPQEIAYLKLFTDIPIIGANGENNYCKAFKPNFSDDHNVCQMNDMIYTPFDDFKKFNIYTTKYFDKISKDGIITNFPNSDIDLTISSKYAPFFDNVIKDDDLTSYIKQDIGLFDSIKDQIINAVNLIKDDHKDPFIKFEMNNILKNSELVHDVLNSCLVNMIDIQDDMYISTDANEKINKLVSELYASLIDRVDVIKNQNIKRSNFEDSNLTDIFSKINDIYDKTLVYDDDHAAEQLIITTISESLTNDIGNAAACLILGSDKEFKVPPAADVIPLRLLNYEFSIGPPIAIKGIHPGQFNVAMNAVIGEIGDTVYNIASGLYNVFSNRIAHALYDNGGYQQVIEILCDDDLDHIVYESIANGLLNCFDDPNAHEIYNGYIKKSLHHHYAIINMIADVMKIIRGDGRNILSAPPIVDHIDIMNEFADIDINMLKSAMYAIFNISQSISIIHNAFSDVPTINHILNVLKIDPLNNVGMLLLACGGKDLRNAIFTLLTDVDNQDCIDLSIVFRNNLIDQGNDPSTVNFKTIAHFLKISSNITVDRITDADIKELCNDNDITEDILFDFFHQAEIHYKSLFDKKFESDRLNGENYINSKINAIGDSFITFKDIALESVSMNNTTLIGDIINKFIATTISKIQLSKAMKIGFHNINADHFSNVSALLSVSINDEKINENVSLSVGDGINPNKIIGCFLYDDSGKSDLETLLDNTAAGGVLAILNSEKIGCVYDDGAFYETKIDDNNIKRLYDMFNKVSEFHGKNIGIYSNMGINKLQFISHIFSDSIGDEKINTLVSKNSKIIQLLGGDVAMDRMTFKIDEFKNSINNCIRNAVVNILKCGSTSIGYNNDATQVNTKNVKDLVVMPTLADSTSTGKFKDFKEYLNKVTKDKADDLNSYIEELDDFVGNIPTAPPADPLPKVPPKSLLVAFFTNPLYKRDFEYYFNPTNYANIEGFWVAFNSHGLTTLVPVLGAGVTYNINDTKDFLNIIIKALNKISDIWNFILNTGVDIIENSIQNAIEVIKKFNIYLATGGSGSEVLDFINTDLGNAITWAISTTPPPSLIDTIDGIIYKLNSDFTPINYIIDQAIEFINKNKLSNEKLYTSIYETLNHPRGMYKAIEKSINEARKWWGSAYPQKKKLVDKNQFIKGYIEKDIVKLVKDKMDNFQFSINDLFYIDESINIDKLIEYIKRHLFTIKNDKNRLKPHSGLIEIKHENIYILTNPSNQSNVPFIEYGDLFLSNELRIKKCQGQLFKFNNINDVVLMSTFGYYEYDDIHSSPNQYVCNINSLSVDIHKKWEYVKSLSQKFKEMREFSDEYFDNIKCEFDPKKNLDKLSEFLGSNNTLNNLCIYDADENAKCMREYLAYYHCTYTPYLFFKNFIKVKDDSPYHSSKKLYDMKNFDDSQYFYKSNSFVDGSNIYYAEFNDHDEYTKKMEDEEKKRNEFSNIIELYKLYNDEVKKGGNIGEFKAYPHFGFLTITDKNGKYFKEGYEFVIKVASLILDPIMNVKSDEIDALNVNKFMHDNVDTIFVNVRNEYDALINKLTTIMSSTIKYTSNDIYINSNHIGSEFGYSANYKENHKDAPWNTSMIDLKVALNNLNIKTHADKEKEFKDIIKELMGVFLGKYGALFISYIKIMNENKEIKKNYYRSSHLNNVLTKSMKKIDDKIYYNFNKSGFISNCVNSKIDINKYTGHGKDQFILSNNLYDKSTISADNPVELIDFVSDEGKIMQNIHTLYNDNVKVINKHYFYNDSQDYDYDILYTPDTIISRDIKGNIDEVNCNFLHHTNIINVLRYYNIKDFELESLSDDKNMKHHMNINECGMKYPHQFLNGKYDRRMLSMDSGGDTVDSLYALTNMTGIGYTSINCEGLLQQLINKGISESLSTNHLTFINGNNSISYDIFKKLNNIFTLTVKNIDSIIFDKNNQIDVLENHFHSKFKFSNKLKVNFKGDHIYHNFENIMDGNALNVIQLDGNTLNGNIISCKANNEKIVKHPHYIQDETSSIDEIGNNKDITYVCNDFMKLFKPINSNNIGFNESVKSKLQMAPYFDMDTLNPTNIYNYASRKQFLKTYTLNKEKMSSQQFLNSFSSPLKLTNCNDVVTTSKKIIPDIDVLKRFYEYKNNDSKNNESKDNELNMLKMSSNSQCINNFRNALKNVITYSSIPDTSFKNEFVKIYGDDGEILYKYMRRLDSQANFQTNLRKLDLFLFTKLDKVKLPQKLPKFNKIVYDIDDKILLFKKYDFNIDELKYTKDEILSMHNSINNTNIDLSNLTNQLYGCKNSIYTIDSKIIDGLFDDAKISLDMHNHSWLEELKVNKNEINSKDDKFDFLPFYMYNHSEYNIVTSFDDALINYLNVDIKRESYFDYYKRNVALSFDAYFHLMPGVRLSKNASILIYTTDGY